MQSKNNMKTAIRRFKSGCQGTVLACGLVATLACGSSLPAQDASSEASAILQREEIRRQELMLRATKDLQEAKNLIRRGEIDEAAEKLEAIRQAVPNVGAGTAIHNESGKVLSQIETARAAEKLEQKSWFEARDFARSALEADPENERARQIIRTANKELGANEDGEVNPAVDRRFVERYNQVQDLVRIGKEYVETGQYDEAEESFKQALAIDPYNRVAIKELKQLNVILRETAEIAHDSMSAKRAAQVVDKWSEDISVTEETPELIDAAEAIETSNQSLLGNKLKNIVIPDVEFNDATIEDAASFLTVRTREQDQSPEGGGVPFIVTDEALEQARRFSLRLSGVPAGEVLRYATNLAGVKFRIAEYAVFIVPLTTVDDETVITREFPVTPSFFDVAAAGDGEVDTEPRFGRRRGRGATQATTGRGGFDPKEILEARGVDFSASGSAAIYNDATGILTVTNTQNQIDLIEELVIGTNLETLLVKVETKFIEINQTELDSLVPNIRLAGSYTYPSTSGTKFAAGTAQLGTNLSDVQNLRLADALTGFVESDQSIPDRINNPDDARPPSNNVGITGFLDGNGFAALINGLSQAESTELLTAPSLVVNSGEQGTITVAREFFYPTEFDPPEVETSIGVNNFDQFAQEDTDGDGIADLFESIFTLPLRFTAIPAFPTDFEMRNVGVVMSVNPRVSVDRQRVFLNIDPEVVEFEGFINYGSRIFDPSGAAAAPIVENRINQPVFNVRTVENAQVEIQDGYTVVLGGLLREEVSTVEEKVPILGDIPLLGRAFRSEVEQSQRRNLLIFVSVRILRPDGQPYNLQAGSSDRVANTIQ